MIGVFDSGVGGLTVLRAIRDVYPSVDAVYFGDTKNAPYGQRPRSELSALAVEGIRFLLAHDASTIVSACNSVSVSLALSIYDVLSLSSGQLIEMVGPTVSAFKGSRERVALCATVATIESGMYQDAFRMIGKEITAFPIPELAGAIERGEGSAAYERIVRAALSSVDSDAFDTLVLGCTHYPLAIESFQRALPEKTLFDPARAVAERIERDLWPREMGYGRTAFYMSGESAQFRRLCASLFPESEFSVEVAA